MRKLLLAMVLACAVPAAWPQLAKISNQDASTGMKAALERGTAEAVANLGRTDGFLGNSAVKIPLPDPLKRYEKMMRQFGMGKYADELITTMNRAAESAVPEARPLFVDAVRKMTLKDAKGILTGGNTSATDYFKRTMSDTLRGKFLPIVAESTKRVQLAEKYNEYAAKGAKFGLVKKEDASLDGYVTQKTMDGLFYMVGEEEKKIRANPVAAGSDIIKKVFGAMK
jgi:uncharacterized protein DUF4197